MKAGCLFGVAALSRAAAVIWPFEPLLPAAPFNIDDFGAVADVDTYEQVPRGVGIY